MATVANSAGEKPCPTKKQRTHLTPTGLLMEGVCTSVRFYSPKSSLMIDMALFRNWLLGSATQRLQIAGLGFRSVRGISRV
jgi:hypothetical protein